MPAQGTGTALGLWPLHGWGSPDDFHWKAEASGSVHYEIPALGTRDLCQGELWLSSERCPCPWQDKMVFTNLFQPKPFCGSAQSSQHRRHLKLTHKYLAPSPALLCLGKIFPLGVPSCFPVCTRTGVRTSVVTRLRSLLNSGNCCRKSGFQVWDVP